MKVIQDAKLDFNDINLISRQISTIKSRDEINLFSLLFGNKYLSPIIASPMKDVCDGNVANIMEKLGGFGIIHRFLTIENQVLESKKVNNPICAIGINGDYIERYVELINNGVENFCIDVANSSSIFVKEAILKLLSIYSDSKFIVGNVIAKEGIEFYNDIPNVEGFRVSVASGKACTTKNATGMYHPPISLLLECRKVTDKVIIADGGIKEAQDYCKAIACGADFIMIGSLICQCRESPSELILRDNKEYKLYHGSASFENQKIYKENPRYIEGRTVLLEYKNLSIENIINSFQEGLKSSMSYANAINMIEYRKNIEITT